MGDIAEEISAAIVAGLVSARRSTGMDAVAVHEALRQRYAGAARQGELWELVHDDVSIRDAEAWRWPAEFAQGRPVLLTFDPTREQAVFEFDDGADLSAVLGETTGFEFYVTDTEFSFMLCFNHHEYLVATGSAAGWLQRRIGGAGRAN